jgi:hypothetical protein
MKKLLITLALVLGMSASYATSIEWTVESYGHTIECEITVDDALYGVWLGKYYYEAETLDEILYEVEYYIHQVLVLKKEQQSN